MAKPPSDLCNIAEMRLASLRYQLNQLMNRLDSQISI